MYMNKMFYISGLRRLRGFTQSHILENLRDVNKVLSGNHLPSRCEQVLLISRSSSQDLSQINSLKVLTTFEQEQDDFTHQQMHPYQYHHDIDATNRVLSEDVRHNYHLTDDASAVEEDNSSAESEVEETDAMSYGLDSVKTNKVKRGRTYPKYPLFNMGDKSKTFTSNFEKSEKLLESLNLPTVELPHYPAIQEMSEEELRLCISRLNEIGICVVFSLFLIQRIDDEIKHEQNAKRVSLSKNGSKLPTGKYKLASMQPVSMYLKLCRLLENPELDLYRFMDDLSSANVNNALITVVSKIQQLRSVGATPKDILSNLTLLRGCSLFKAKIQLYKNLFLHSKLTFPVNLFLSSTVTEFRQKLQIGQDINVLAHLLGVTPEDFLMCWGFKSFRTRSLMQKINILRNAGISQQDLFNNISMINRLSVKKIQPHLESLSKSGHSISLYELRVLEDDIDLNDPGFSPAQRDWMSEDPSDPGVALPTDKEKTPNNKRNLPKKRRRIYQSMETSKMWRMEVFKLITRHLPLCVKTRKAMYKANVSVDSTHIQDITQNLNHLMSDLQFTKEQISACPLILAHPHKDLYRVTREVHSLLAQHFAWSTIDHIPSTHTADFNDINPTSSFSSSEFVQISSPSSSLSSLSSPLTSFTSEENLASSYIEGKSGPPWKFDISNCRQKGMTHFTDYSHLLSDPIIHLNILQYFLEKETGFSLLSPDAIDF